MALEGICIICSRQYMKNSNNQKYCSDKCRMKTMRCVECGTVRKVHRSNDNLYCSLTCSSIGKRKPHSQFVRELLEVHEGMIVPLEIYDSSDSDIKCLCINCGQTMSRPAHRYIGSYNYGCSSCRTCSKGELAISRYLDRLGYEYEREFTFEDLMYRSYLKFDFAVFIDGDLSLLIEFDGVQHYEPVDFFGGIDSYKETVIRDNIKDEYAEGNNIPLLRIRYEDEHIVDDILERAICKVIINKG